jgi:hypothetical protein
MGEDHADRRLALTNVLCECRTGFGVLLHIRIELLPILPALVLTLQLQDRNNRRVRRARAGGVGHDELAFEGMVEEIIPRFRRLQLVFFQEMLVTGKAE